MSQGVGNMLGMFGNQQVSLWLGADGQSGSRWVGEIEELDLRGPKLDAQCLEPGSLGNGGIGRERSRACSHFMTSLSSESHEQGSLLLRSLFAYKECKRFRRRSYDEDSEKEWARGCEPSESPLPCWKWIRLQVCWQQEQNGKRVRLNDIWGFDKYKYSIVCFS